MAGTLYIVSAPSGAGKTSLVKALLQEMPDIVSSVSFTTRSPRAMEVDGRDYHFVSCDEFERMLKNGEFLETAKIYDHWYGTSKLDVMRQLQSADVVLEIDWQGARQVLTLLDQPAVTIFVLPPSLSELERRLRKRAQDADAVIQQRLMAAKEEIRHANEYQFVIINEDFSKASGELNTIIRAFRLNRAHQAAFLERLLSEG